MFFQPYHFDAYNPHTGTFSYGFLRKLFTGQYRSYGKHSYHIRVDNISWPTTANSHCVCSHCVWPPALINQKDCKGFIKFFSKVATELNFFLQKKNSCRWSNQAGKLILAVIQSAWCLYLSKAITDFHDKKCFVILNLEACSSNNNSATSHETYWLSV